MNWCEIRNNGKIRCGAWVTLGWAVNDMDVSRCNAIDRSLDGGFFASMGMGWGLHVRSIIVRQFCTRDNYRILAFKYYRQLFCFKCVSRLGLFRRWFAIGGRIML